MVAPSSRYKNDKQFLLCLPLIITQEGGNDDDPHDPGGRTSRGIIQREYDKYRKRHGLPVRDVWHADWDEIFDIYYGEYWLPWCPQIWHGLDLMVFDQSVNQGLSQAVKNLQRALNAYHDPGWTAAALRSVYLRSSTVTVDGRLGPATMLAINALYDHGHFLKAYFDWDMSFYRQLRNWARYGRGWKNRATSIYNSALKML